MRLGEKRNRKTKAHMPSLPGDVLLKSPPCCAVHGIHLVPSLHTEPEEVGFPPPPPSSRLHKELCDLLVTTSPSEIREYISIDRCLWRYRRICVCTGTRSRCDAGQSQLEQIAAVPVAPLTALQALAGPRDGIPTCADSIESTLA